MYQNIFCGYQITHLLQNSMLKFSYSTGSLFIIILYPFIHIKQPVSFHSTNFLLGFLPLLFVHSTMKFCRFNKKLKQFHFIL